MERGMGAPRSRAARLEVPAESSGVGPRRGGPGLSEAVHIEGRWDAAFTGHRPQSLGGFDSAAPLNRRVRVALHAQVRGLYRAGARSFGSGMAQGVDQWAAEAVLALKTRAPDVRLVAAVPCDAQDAPWARPARVRYAELLQGADEVHIVAPGPYAGWKMEARNRWMVDRARTLVAVWDGRHQGGTYNTVRYARERGVGVLQLNPVTLPAWMDQGTA